MSTASFTIEVKGEEQDLIESLLNMRHSGISQRRITLYLALTAMARGWKLDKLNYYLNLLEID